MKHSDFLKALKTLKSHIITNRNKQKILTIPQEDKPHKTYCTCKDSNGENKYLYNSQKEIKYLLSSRNISLYSYPCPYEKGWHLTKG
ncbi:MAG: hypothetical protein COB07_08680 [Sulfurovum sp.]|nr:MAG: hypothetical protein COB07_08680 [Sulfurovum sp.]